MRNPTNVLTEFVLAKLDGEPVTKRARIYRALANVATPKDRKRFEQLAADCDAITNAHDQLVLDFKRRARA